MAEARLPTSVVVSLGLHGGALVRFGLMIREGPKEAPKMTTPSPILPATCAPSARSVCSNPA